MDIVSPEAQLELAGDRPKRGSLGNWVSRMRVQILLAFIEHFLRLLNPKLLGFAMKATVVSDFYAKEAVLE